MIVFFKICIFSFFSFSIFFITKKFFNYFYYNSYNSNNKNKPTEFGVIINENEMINSKLEIDYDKSEVIPLNTEFLSPPSPSPSSDDSHSSNDSSNTPILRHYYNADHFEDYDSCT